MDTFYNDISIINEFEKMGRSKIVKLAKSKKSQSMEKVLVLSETLKVMQNWVIYDPRYLHSRVFKTAIRRLSSKPEQTLIGKIISSMSFQALLERLPDFSSRRTRKQIEEGKYCDDDDDLKTNWSSRWSNQWKLTVD
ncbi:hypothetical protein HELRODRAFT_175677 [Helobdella robusta]|uniref:Uncharacterized protein n=1 Tax=Helobdella robusta TaxID=6412 RepID=T1F9I5_HELRO|nr:hypothetical protein HELRODRAFT_175677 [Helobdella robusta]ESO00692.1 hypothetical protein HELRODRAFT_175677 [Helobdella robusta]